MIELINTLGEHKGLAIVLTIAFVVVFVSVLHAIRDVVVGIARERTRREIAAYVAEGSITSDEGERLLRAKATRSCATEV